MKLGFIGTGIITTSVVTGFCESGMENLQIVVSPRNKERAQMLHEWPEQMEKGRSARFSMRFCRKPGSGRRGLRLLIWCA